jgi:phytoene synthase
MSNLTVDERNLRLSRQWCARLCRRSKSSFYYSFSLLDRPRRDAMIALYAFARITDDLGDSSEPVDVRTAQLLGWRKLLSEQIPELVPTQVPAQVPGASSPIAPLVTPQAPSPAGRLSAANPLTSLDTSGESPNANLSLQQFSLLWPALRDCVTRYQMPRALLDDIVQGVAMDLTHEHPANWGDLRRYCYHVASAVGLACVYIWRAGDEIPEPQAIDCGMAFQLTNILRDIAEDARMGRVYLPLSEFASFGVDLERWLYGDPNGRWQDLVAHVAQEARERYASGWQTIDFLTPPSQRMFSLMWRSYRGLLERVIDSTDQLWGEHKIRLPQSQRLGLFTSHAFPPFFARLPAP